MISWILLAWVSLAAVLYGYNQYRFHEGEKRYPPNGQFVTVDGYKLHYLEKGTGKPVVFLHGGVLSADDFADVLELTARQGYRAIAFDRPGYGHSERPRKEAVTPAVQARLIHDALQQLGVEKPVLVGHSWSGVLVLTYALLYPADVAGIVTLGGAMYKEGYPAENGDPLSQVVTTPVIGSVLLHTLLHPLGSTLADGMLTATFAPEPVPADYRKRTKALLLRPEAFRANREDVLAFPPAAQAVSARYKEIQQPVVIVVGAQDPFGTIAQAERLHREIPHSQLLVLPAAAHMIPQHHPEQVVEAVNRIYEP
ncbi:alpha/beta fold hydrolase [Brevibacillus marinus]|uniref:alpha/beta fold hydrolase n=1 Tax=Brevibacillus marinus TaxID=2496837 RepID=UPI000F839A23|nr:alpha/beta hydrolase [Brevibacillus marinus]